MTYGLVADLHAHNWAAYASVNSEGINTRLVQIMDELMLCCVNVSNAGGKTVYVAGDLFHVRGQIKTSVFNYVNMRLRHMSVDFGVHILIMPGNHDLEGAELTWEGNAALTLETDDVMEVGEGVQIVQDPYVHEEDKVAMVPWRNTREGLLQGIEQIVQEIQLFGDTCSDYDLLLHTGINGVISGMPDHGWSVDELADLGFKRVFAGHYHNHKAFELGDDRYVVSIGATTHQTWGDVGTKAGHIIVDDDDFTHNETNAPHFLDWDDVDNVGEVYGNYVRVRGDYTEQEIIDLKEALQEAGAAGISIQAIPKNKVVSRPGASPGKSVKIETSITDWIKNAEVDHQESVEKLALDVLAEARSAA